MATGPADTRKFLDEPCGHCGAPRRVVNPYWLRFRRQDAGLGLKHVGAALKLSVVYLSDIERGRRACPVWVREFYEGLGR